MYTVKDLQTCIHMHMCIYVTYKMALCICPYIHTYIHTCMHTCTQTDIHRHTQTYTDIHAYGQRETERERERERATIASVILLLSKNKLGQSLKPKP